MAIPAKLEAVADAIRAKTGKSAKMTLDEMPDEIAGISGGGGVMENKLQGRPYQITADMWGSATSVPENVLRYDASCTSVEVPSTVTSVGSYAFCDATALTSFGGADSAVRSIGDRAFWRTPALVSINVADVETIGQYGLSGSGLTSVSLPKIQSIGTYALASCANLVSVTFGDDLTSLPQSALYGCVQLANFVGLNGIVSFDSSCLANCQSLSVGYTSPADAIYFGNNCFVNCAITQLDLGAATSVRFSGFIGAMRSLERIVMPPALDSINMSNAFGAAGFDALSYVDIGLCSLSTSGSTVNFSTCAQGCKFIVRRTEPQAITTYALHSANLKQKAVLYVPDESIEAYRANAQWAQFSDIKGISEL